jgi:hypothetical protein
LLNRWIGKPHPAPFDAASYAPNREANRAAEGRDGAKQTALALGLASTEGTNGCAPPIAPMNGESTAKSGCATFAETNEPF